MEAMIGSQKLGHFSMTSLGKEKCIVRLTSYHVYKSTVVKQIIMLL